MRFSRLCLSLALFLLAYPQVKAQEDSPVKVIGRILIAGNQVTKDHIILRELDFKPGDSIPATQLESRFVRSRSNLVNTLLFNYVELRPLPIDSVFCDVLIVVTERWYLWPIPVFRLADPNFNTWWENKDFSRTNWGLILLKNNFRGRNETLGFKAQLGYSKEFGFVYRIPYLTKQQNIGAGISAFYVQNHEVTVGTVDNKRIFYTGDTGNSREELSVKLYGTYRRRLYNTHTLEMQFHRNSILDTIARLNPDYFLPGRTDMGYLSAHYSFRNDTRDNKGYPLTGTLRQVDLVKHGLGFGGSKDLNVFSATGTLNEYFRLSDRFYFAAQLKAKYTPTGHLPYYFQEGLGYSSLIRGYEYYIVDGQHYGLFKSGLKWQVFGPRLHELKMLERTNFARVHYAFYLNLYVDAGYVYDRLTPHTNPLANQFLYGSGLGLDFVSFYDKVIRFEYSVNKELQHGFFLHFIKPI